MHKKLVAAYQKYVQCCLDMIASLEGEVELEAFNQAEQHQDEATDTIAFAIQRMTHAFDETLMIKALPKKEKNLI